MSTLAPPIPRPKSARSSTLPNWQWTWLQFHRLGDMGWFEGKTVMLIEGEIKEMPGPNPPHTTANELTLDAVKAAFGAGFYVRGQQPLELGQTTDPVPDVAVVKGNKRDYATVHPTAALLVIEVSESTIDYDDGDKANLYAAGAIADYWVVDLVNRQLIVYRDPVPDTSCRHGACYQSRLTYGPGASVSPIAATHASIATGDLLP